jgi:hypothetical protein
VSNYYLCLLKDIESNRSSTRPIPSILDALDVDLKTFEHERDRIREQIKTRDRKLKGEFSTESKLE